MEIIFAVLTLLAVAHARNSVMYAHEKMSDTLVQQCLTEMFSKSKLLDIQESDEPCIIFCVLKKFGIMNSNGGINLDVYRKRLRYAHQLDRDNSIVLSNSGSNCYEAAESTLHKQDVCRKAKVFNDCTKLYRVVLQ